LRDRAIHKGATSIVTHGFSIAQPAANVVDPHLTTDRRANLGIRFATYDALVARDINGSFVPSLATQWKLESDARTWTFTLRDRVFFHSGEQLRARHILASFRRILDSGIGGELGTTGVIQGYLAGSELHILDELTFQIISREPMADLLDLIVDLPIVSESMSGTGPYTIHKLESARIEMSAFPGHWRGTPAHDRLHWIAIPDAGDRLSALVRGEVDLITDVPVGQVDPNSRFLVTEQLSPTCLALLLRCFDGPTSDQRVRQALNFGLDKRSLIRDAIGGDGEILDGPLTPLHLAHDPSTEPYPFDRSTAKSLLVDAGYTEGLKITLDIPTSLPDEAPELARLIAAQWDEIGVQTTIRTHEDREAYANMVRNKAFGDAACFDSSPLSSFRVLREKLHSRVAGPWWQGYANVEVDALLDAASATADELLRQALYRRSYRLIRDDAPWVFLYRPAYRWASRSGEGWSPTPVGWVQVR